MPWKATSQKTEPSLARRSSPGCADPMMCGADTRVCHVGTFQKPCRGCLRSFWDNQFQAKLLRAPGESSDLLLAVPGLVVFDSFVNILLPVLDEPVEQAG